MLKERSMRSEQEIPLGSVRNGPYFGEYYLVCDPKTEQFFLELRWDIHPPVSPNPDAPMSGVDRWPMADAKSHVPEDIWRKAIGERENFRGKDDT
jgi:hypothetical protein